MICPYCGKEMQKGYLQSARPFFWGTEKHSGFFVASDETDVKVSRGFWHGCFAESWYCADCKKLITEVKAEQ